MSRPSEFTRQVVHTIVSRVALLPLGVIVSALLARALGPAGRGELAVATAFATVCMQFGNLGLHTSNTYFVARQRDLLPTLTANTLALSLGLGSLVALGIGIVLTAFPGLAPVHGALLGLSLVWVPLGLASMLVQNLLIGIQQVRVRNRVEIGQQLIGILLLVGLLALGLATPASAYAASLLALVVALVWSLYRLGEHMDGRLRPSFDLLREHLRYGLKSYFTSLCAYLMLRVDLLMIQYMRGAEETGYYSVAVNMADLIYMIPATVSFILFPQLSALSDPRQQWRRAVRVTLQMAALLVPIALVTSALAPWVVRLLFGPEFLPAVPAFRWLMPGIVAYGATFALPFLMSVGLPAPVLLIWAGLVSLNVVLNWVLIGRLGFVGASVSSSITYVTCFVAFTLYARRVARDIAAAGRP